jgi:hypothetical protein
MACPKAGFTPLKIISLVVTGAALVVHITAVAYPAWDEMDVVIYGVKIEARGSLFDFTVVVDESRNAFSPYPDRRDTGM